MDLRSFALVLSLSAVAAACGRVEIPAQNSPPRAQGPQAPEPPPPVAAPTTTVRTASLEPPTARRVREAREARQAPQQPQQTATASDATFVGASAVRVGPGDTVYALSRRHRVPVPAIIRANNLKPPYLLNVGQRIELPRGKQHKIGPGDTLYSIAQNYDVGVYELARLNDIGPPYTARLGSTLVIPESEAEKPPEPVARTAPSTPSAPAPAPPPAPRPESEVSPSGQIVLLPPQKPPVPVPPPPARSGSGFVWPVKGTVISNFGAKKGGLRNDGINIRAGRGTPIVAAENGVVAYAGNEIRGFGNLLLIKHTDGYITAYAHSDQLLVSRGQKVTRGQRIATVGSTGSVGEPQLHFEVRKGRRPQDPRKYLKG